MDYGKLRPIERVVLFEAFQNERFAMLTSLAAQSMSAADPKKASDFIHQYMDYAFPDLTASKQASVEKRAQELQEFSKRAVSLVPEGLGFALKVEEKK